MDGWECNMFYFFSAQMPVDADGAVYIPTHFDDPVLMVIEREIGSVQRPK